MRYAIAYDVSEDRTRSRVRSVCRKYGARQQYSLFEVRLSAVERAEMVDELRQVVNGCETGIARVRIYSVGPRENDINIPESADDDEEPANIV